MNKKLNRFALILVVLVSCPFAFAVEAIPKAEPENYCKDPNSWAEWDAIDFFDRAHNMVLQKKLAEQNETKKSL